MLTLKDFNSEEIEYIIDKGIEIKKNPENYSKILKNKTLVMIFQKPSTRTRCSFEVGMTQFGGHGIYLDWNTTQLKKDSSIKDEISCISRYSDIIMGRVFEQKTIEEIAKASKVPVINGLSDKYHPCQILSDLMTIKEKKSNLEDLTLAYVGDGNNVCNSLINGCIKSKIKINVATPKGYEPYEKSKYLSLFNEPKKAIQDADIIYSDVWVSMGEEAKKDRRLKDFKNFQINKELLGGSDALIMHCLPAYRGYEITDEIIDSKNSIIYEQAENRLHAQKSLILYLLDKI